MSSLSGLESPRAESPPALKLTPASPSDIEAELPPEGNTPPASGSTTPTASVVDSDTLPKKSFLAFSPLAGFLRSRYPTVTATTKSQPENGDTSSGSSEDSEDSESAEEAEEDRRTIRGVVIHGDADEDKTTVNGHANGSTDKGGKKEKEVGDDVYTAVVNHIK
jgi:UV radiation resistance-associated gene protein